MAHPRASAVAAEHLRPRQPWHWPVAHPPLSSSSRGFHYSSAKSISASVWVLSTALQSTVNYATPGTYIGSCILVQCTYVHNGINRIVLYCTCWVFSSGETFCQNSNSSQSNELNTKHFSGLWMIHILMIRGKIIVLLALWTRPHNNLISIHIIWIFVPILLSESLGMLRQFWGSAWPRHRRGKLHSWVTGSGQTLPIAGKWQGWRVQPSVHYGKTGRHYPHVL